MTERTQYEHRLRALNELTRQLMTASTAADVADITAHVAADVLDQPLTAIWRYDADDERLVPSAATDVAADLDESGE